MKKKIPLDYVINSIGDESYKYLDDLIFIKDLDWNSLKQYLRAKEYAYIDIFYDYYFNGLTYRELRKKHKASMQYITNALNKIKKILRKIGGEE
jgi:hypothetical protein